MVEVELGITLAFEDDGQAGGGIPGSGALYLEVVRLTRVRTTA